MGMKEPEMDRVAAWIDAVCRNLASLDAVAPKVRAEIADFCSQFTPPGLRE
jgi:glycine/serine hydroxymethyltransferase